MRLVESNDTSPRGLKVDRFPTATRGWLVKGVLIARFTCFAFLCFCRSVGVAAGCSRFSVDLTGI